MSAYVYHAYVWKYGQVKGNQMYQKIVVRQNDQTDGEE